MRVAVPFAKAVGRVRQAISDELIAAWSMRPIREHTVLYESFSGNGMLCNPEAVFRAARADPDLRHLRHTWVLSSLDTYRSTVEEFADDPSVDFVRYRSLKYFRALGRSQYLVNNATFPSAFVKRPGQIYLNTWHGVPLKRMGYDMPGGAYESLNVVRNFMSADFLGSANAFMTTTMYRRAYPLDGLYEGRVLELGQPRTDHHHVDIKQLRDELSSAGVELNDGPIVLYAPTWRGASFHQAEAGVALLRGALDQLTEKVGGLGANILLKVHQQVYDQIVDEPDFAGRLVPNRVPTNRALATADVLVTDYSSIFFDFLALDRPIVFYVPDLERYAADRGWYLDVEDWPGTVVRSPAQLGRVVTSALDGGEPSDVASRRRRTAREHCPRDDGNAGRRTVDAVFKGATDNGVVELARRDKPRVLIYLGGMRSNGITTSALGLLDNLDLSRVDVSVYYSQTSEEQCRANIGAIAPGIRQFAQMGPMLMSRIDAPGRRVLTTRGDVDVIGRGRLDALFRLEWRRSFGDAQFDHVVDFSGYAAFWAFLLLASGAPSSSIWLHNDLLSDSRREIDGHRPHQRSLESVFTLYHRFDHLVSVSSALADVNRRKLAAFADASMFTFAQNTLPTRRIDEGTLGLEAVAPKCGSDAPIEVVDLMDTIDQLVERFDAADIAAAIERRAALDRWMPDRGSASTFVAVGRLSPEKNFARLIRAFAEVHHDRPDTRLLILGDGPLRRSLAELAAAQGVADAVALAGHQDNPYQFMAAADCFVMSSDYEGQPMVILEARYLGLPIVITDFESAPGALAPDEGLIVDRSVAGLVSGLCQMLDGNVPVKPFDVDAYNAAAIEQFYRAIGVAEPTSDG